MPVGRFRSWPNHSARPAAAEGAGEQTPGYERPRAGFSLIELLITLALLIIMMTVYWGRGSASRQRRDLKACGQNLEKIFVAMQIYANDHAGRFPDVAGARTSEEALDALVPRYTVDTSVFICPGTKDAPLPSGESFRNRTISYAYYMGRALTNAEAALMSDRQVDTRSKAAGQLLFSQTGKPPGSNHSKYGGNLLFCDGRTETSRSPARMPLPLPPGVVLLNPKP